MKILFLTRLFPNDYNSRSGKVMFQQAKELKRLGHEVVVVSPTPFTPIVIRRFREEWKVYSQLPNKELYNGILVFRPRFIRSEEHTSELQSRGHLVCRLL